MKVGDEVLYRGPNSTLNGCVGILREEPYPGHWWWDVKDPTVLSEGCCTEKYLTLQKDDRTIQFGGTA